MSESTHPDPHQQTAERSPLRDDEQLGRYVITGRLGAGGMGEVLAVRDAQIGRTVAAKVVRGAVEPVQLAKFCREAQLTGQLEHPNIMPVYELGRAVDGQPYFTMRRVEGDDLQVVLEGAETGDGIDLTLLSIFLKICDAVAFAHSRGVIHRDLKPANILVGRFGEVLVCDWGLAKPLADGATAEPVELPAGPALPSLADATPLATLEGQIVGTPAYMAPEQARGEVDRLSRRTDVFALGAILYQMLAGVPPHSGGSTFEVILHAGQGRLVPPSQVAPERRIPWELEAVALRAMAADPDARYADVGQLAADVTRYLEGGLVSAARYRRWQRVARWVGRHRALLMVLLALAVGAAATPLLSRWQRLRQLPQQLAAAQTSLERGELEAADVAFGRVLEVDPANPTALAGRLEARHALNRRAVRAERRLQLERALATAQAPLARGPELERLIAAARARLAAAGAGPEAPAPAEERVAREALLDAFLTAVSGLDQALRLVPDHPAALAARRRAGALLGRAALLGGDYTLARHAFGELARHGASPAEVKALLFELESARSRRLAARQDRLAAILEDLGQGLGRRDRPTSAPLLEDLVLEAVAFRDREAVARLAEALAPLTRRAREAGRAARWTPAELDTARFCCRVLARLQQPGIVAPLAELLAVAWDRELVVEAGRALCLTGHAAARVALVEARQRLGVQSAAWRRIEPLMGRLPAPAAVSGADDLVGLVRRADHRVEIGDWPGVVADCDAILRLRPRSVFALTHRAVALAIQGDTDGAIAGYTRAIEVQPDTALPYIGRGSVRLRMGRLDEAEQDARAGIQRDPAVVAGRVLLANVHYHRSQYSACLAELERARTIDRTDVMPLLLAASAHRALRQPARALAVADEAVALQPRRAEAHHARAHALDDLQRRADALAACSKAVELAPRLLAAVALRAKIQVGLRAYESALADLDHVLKLDPEFAGARAMRLRIQALIRRPDPKAAWAELERALADARDARQRALIHVERARYLRRVGRGREALAEIDRAIAAHPSLPVAHAQRGSIRAELGAPAADVDADFARALSLDPRKAESYYLRGMVRRARRDLRGALADAERHVALAPDSPDAYRLRGTVKHRLRDYAGALADYQRVLARKPADAQAHLNRGLALESLGRSSEALAAFEAAVRHQPTLGRAHYRIGRRLKAAKRYAAAEAAYGRAIEHEPASVGAWAERGLMRVKQGKLEAAIADYREAIRRRGDWTERFNLGVALERVGRKAEARAAFAAALEKAPEGRKAMVRKRLADVAGD